MGHCIGENEKNPVGYSTEQVNYTKFTWNTQNNGPDVQAASELTSVKEEFSSGKSLKQPHLQSMEFS